MAIATVRPAGYRQRPMPCWESRQVSFTEIALFLFGVAGVYSVNLVGALPGCEILLFPLLPILLLSHGKRAFDRQYLYFYLVACGWFLGTQFADTFNDVGWINRLKGTARVIFFILDFMALAMLINNKTRRIVIFVVSIAAQLMLGTWQFEGDFGLMWKYGFSQGLAMLAMIGVSFLYSQKRYRVSFLIVIILAALNLKYGFRSQLAIVAVSAVMIVPLNQRPRGNGRQSGSTEGNSKTFLLLFLALGAAWAANSSIKYAARAGLFDESQTSKFLGQAEGDYGVLVGGRPETLVAIQAIRDKPILGHGSFPYGMKYLQLEQDIQYEHGYSDSDTPEDVDYPVIPTHSHLTLGWVESGILGGICWIYILLLIVRATLRVIKLRPALGPLYSYLLVSFLWDILYSPFGSVNRIRAAFYILLAYHLLRSPAPAEAKSRSRNPYTKVIYRNQFQRFSLRERPRVAYPTRN